MEEKLNIQAHEDLLLSVGAVYSYQDIIPKTTVPGRAQRGGNIVAQAGSFSYYTLANDSSSQVDVARATNLTYDSYGAYLEGHYSAWRPWELIVGARWDGDSRYSTRPFSPRLALVYNNPDHRLTAKYIFTKAFVAPAPYFGYNVYDNGQAFNTINADLSPEKATANELNLSWRGDHVLLGGSLFYNQQDNLLLVGDLAQPVNILADEVYMDPAGTQPRLLTQSANSGSSRAKGFDLYGRYSAEQISLWASYSYVDFASRIASLVTALAGSSQHNVRLGGAWEIRNGLVVTPSLVYRSTPQGIDADNGLASALRHPYEINAHILYSLQENLDLFLNIRNLTNHKYALRGLQAAAPQEELQAMLGFKLTL